MKPLKFIIWSGRIQSFTPPAFSAISLAVLLTLAEWTSPAAGTVSNCTESELRAALAGGGTVNFACDGTITLASTIPVTADAVLDGSGHQVVISGNNSVRMFFVATNVNFTVVNLTIVNGRSDSGAAIYNSGGGLTITNCCFVANQSQGLAGAYGTGTNGQSGYGGALYNSGFARINNCAFLSNSVVGGTGGDGLTAGPDSSSRAGPGGKGGDGNGGAIYNFGTLTMSGCWLANNSASGGNGGGGGWGGFVFFGGGHSGGQGGTGGNGNGGALFNAGAAVLLNNTIVLNSGVGAPGGYGGTGGSGSSPDFPRGSNGDGGAGGSGFGAVYDVNALCYLTNCTLSLNSTTNGHGGYYGANGIAGGGGLRAVGTTLVNTLLSANTPSNCSGTITDAGPNLSSDASCAFTNVGSLNNTDPKLGPLANNGGPTLTMALLPGSPAMDAGTVVGSPATDQRGVARPQGRGVDIGAYEFQFNTPLITNSKFQSSTSFWLQACGVPNQTYVLQTSTNLLNWSDIADLPTGSNGVCEYIERALGNCGTRLYRLRALAP